MASSPHPTRSTASAVKQLLFPGDAVESTLSDSARSRRLSVADISACLTRLQQQSDEAKLRIVQEIEGRQDELRHLMSHACQAGDDVAVLLGEVDGLLRGSSRGCKGGLGYVNDVSQLAGELRDLGSRAAEKAEACSALQEVQRWQQAIAAVEQMVAEGRHLEASPTVANLKSTLDAIKDAARQSWGHTASVGEGEGTVNGQLRVLQLIEDRLETISKEVSETEQHPLKLWHVHCTIFQDSEGDAKGDSQSITAVLHGDLRGIPVLLSHLQLTQGMEQQLWACLLVDPQAHTITVRPSISVSQSGNDTSAGSSAVGSGSEGEAPSADAQPLQSTEVALWSIMCALEVRWR